ncbi:helix-turn-helix domain-containing protein, partial [Rothia aeria]
MAYIPTKVRRASRTIGEQLRIQRKLMGLTAQMVAERADITTVTLRRIEQGESVRTDVL